MRARNFVTLTFFVSLLCFSFLFIAYVNITRILDSRISPVLEAEPALNKRSSSSAAAALLTTQNRSLSRPTEAIKEGEEEEEEEARDVYQFNPKFGEWDSSRKYKHFPNVLIGSEFTSLSSEFDVTLATQAPLDRLHWLPVLTRTWTGPISVSVFVPDVELQVRRV